MRRPIVLRVVFLYNLFSYVIVLSYPIYGEFFVDFLINRPITDDDNTTHYCSFIHIFFLYIYLAGNLKFTTFTINY